MLLFRQEFPEKKPKPTKKLMFSGLTGFLKLVLDTCSGSNMTASRVLFYHIGAHPTREKKLFRVLQYWLLLGEWVGG